MPDEDYKTILNELETQIEFYKTKQQEQEDNKNAWKKYINTIQCMDCFDGLKIMPEDSVDISITSPPYNMSVRVGEGDLYDEYSDDLTSEEYTEFINHIITELLRVTRYYVFFNIQMLGSNKATVLNIFSKYAENIKEVVIWAKTACPPASSERCMSNQYEFIFCLSKYDRKGKQFVRAFFDNRTAGHDNITNCLIRNMQKDNKCPEHKATFPEWLPEFFIKHFSREQDLILDPFAGTGTTQFIAKQMNRNYIGFELSKNYCEFAEKRLSQVNLSEITWKESTFFTIGQKRLDV